MHRLQLSFVNFFIAPIGFRCFPTLNVIYLRIYVRDVVVLKCCSKWAANESYFSHSWVDVVDRKNDRPFFFESLPSVPYINSVTHRAFYFIDYTFRPEFNFIEKNFRWLLMEENSYILYPLNIWKTSPAWFSRQCLH